MRKIVSLSAFTLIELIVASLLVAVVVIGIINVSMVLNNNNQDYGQLYSVKSQTQVTLDNILNNVALAVGSGNNNDEAILYSGNYAGFDANTFCIHQQPGGATPDQWLCYQWYTNSGVNAYEIESCVESYTSGSDPRGASSCSSPINPPLISGPTYLGTAYSNPSVSFNTSGQSLFSITLTNYLNNAGSISDQEDNPGVTLSGSATPLQAST